MREPSPADTNGAASALSTHADKATFEDRLMMLFDSIERAASPPLPNFGYTEVHSDPGSATG